MQSTTSIARKLKLGGVALVAAGSLALSATAAEAAPSKVDGGQTAAAAGNGKVVAASDHGKRTSKRRKRCKRPKVAVRRHGRTRCIRPKRAVQAPLKQPAPAPAPQQVPSNVQPKDPGTTGGSDEAAKPTSQALDKLTDQASRLGPVVIGTSAFEERFAGCSNALRADWGWYAFCDTQRLYGGIPLSLVRDFYYWDGYQWIYFDWELYTY